MRLYDIFSRQTAPPPNNLVYVKSIWATDQGHAEKRAAAMNIKSPIAAVALKLPDRIAWLRHTVETRPN